MKINIEMPMLGENGPDEGTISFWLVDPGEPFKKGDDLVEILTDKAAFKVPAPEGGRLVEIHAGEGRKAKVGNVIAVMETGA
jgi:pyruvate/2-oxoglutarate dehydrogenase complex dihydrolipoamide acyltransferase (E2) component